MAIATVPSVTDPRELALLKAVGLDRVGPEQRELALNIAQRYELDLMLKHLVLIDGKPYITRDGLLHVAHRDGQLDGIVTTEPVLVDGFWRSTCSVYRKDMRYPFTYTGRYPVDGMNKKFAPEMAVKVGEVMALRRAFDVAAPVAEERWDTEVPTVQVERPPTLAEKAAAKRAEIAAPEAAQATETAADAEAEAMGAPAVDEAPAAIVGGMTSAQLSEAARGAGVNKMALAAALEVVPEDVAKRIIAMTDAERYELAQRLGIVS